MTESEAPKPAGSFVRTAIAGLLFIVGLCGTLSGVLALSTLAFQFFKMTMNHVAIHRLGGLLALAYGVIGCSGIAWITASYFCAAAENRKTAYAVVAAGLLWGLFFLIFPGPVAL